MNGWGQWGSYPANKFHYFIEDSPGHHLSACAIFGLISTKTERFVEDPPIKRRCKLCIRALEESRQ